MCNLDDDRDGEFEQREAYLARLDADMAGDPDVEHAILNALCEAAWDYDYDYPDDFYNEEEQ